MNVVIYFSLSKELNSKKIASSYDGDIFELVNKQRKHKFKAVDMFIYGYKTVANKNVKFEVPDIDFNKYDTVVLVSPVWAGRVNQFMRKYLEKVPFKNKKVIIVGSCDGGYSNYFSSYEGLLDKSNEVIEEVMYVKGIRQ
jgi:hypothetical protein